MYRTCIFCSADLGANDIIEEFPVGSQIAYDVGRGRLWAVCARCGRWNLAPIEERWEAVECAEELFRASNMRVHNENIGIARMRDGSRLVRIGQALPGEIAAWRYGSELLKRRRKYHLGLAATGVVMAGMFAGIPVLLAAGFPMSLFSLGINANASIQKRRREGRVIARIDAERSPTGEHLILQQRDLGYARITNDAGEFAVALRRVSRPVKWYKLEPTWPQPEPNEIVIRGTAARSIVSKSVVNSTGASKTDIARAVKIMETLGSAQGVLDAISKHGPALHVVDTALRNSTVISERALVKSHYGLVLDDRARPVKGAQARLGTIPSLALEMALHEESERRALEGELEELEEAWREAEMIARIADALPGEPPDD